MKMLDFDNIKSQHGTHSLECTASSNSQELKILIAFDLIHSFLGIFLDSRMQTYEKKHYLHEGIFLRIYMQEMTLISVTGSLKGL